MKNNYDTMCTMPNDIKSKHTQLLGVHFVNLLTQLKSSFGFS